MSVLIEKAEKDRGEQFPPTFVPCFKFALDAAVYYKTGCAKLSQMSVQFLQENARGDGNCVAVARWAGGDDKHVEELLQLVEESDRLREEYASESAGAGDLMKEINELLNGDAANIYDDILVQQVDDVLNDNDDLKDLKDLMKDTGAATLVDITPGNNNDKKTNNNNDETTTTMDGEENPTDPSIADLMAEVKNLMADFEVDGSVQALKDAMMAAYTEEGGESAHQQNDEL